jgi:mono/diheme cytochrome c family protein
VKKLAALCLCALAALALIPPADAGCRRVVHQQAVVVEQVAVVQPVIATAFLAVPVPVYPVYGATYGQGDVAAEVRALRQTIERLSAPQTPAAKVPPAAMPRADDASVPPLAVSAAPKVISATCLRCHGPTNPKGGVSLAGDVPQLVKLKAFRAVALGKMPPNGPAVSDEDLAALAAWCE